MEHSHAMQLVKSHMKNRNLIKHVYAVEAVMGALARFITTRIRGGWRGFCMIWIMKTPRTVLSGTDWRPPSY